MLDTTDPNYLIIETARRFAQERLAPTGISLVAFLVDDDASRIELPVLRMGSGDVVAAFEDAGINALLAPDEEALATSVGRLLERSGFLRFAEEVEVHRAAPPRAERL